MKVELSPSQAQEAVTITQSGRSTSLNFTRTFSAILFYDGKPIAVSAGNITSSYCHPGPEQRAVNAWAKKGLIIRVSAEQLDFLVGQILTGAGLPLTHTAPADGTE